MHKLIEASVLAAIGVLVFAALLIPVVDDATATTEKLTNTGYYTMDKVDADANFTLTWDSATPLTIDVNGNKLDLTDRGLVYNMSYTIFGGDNFVLRLRTGPSGTVCQYYGSQTVTPAFMYADTITNTSITATVANGEISISTTNSSYPDTATFDLTDKTYCINVKDTGAFVMKKSNESVFIVSNTDIIVLDGITTLTANDVGIYADGTISGDLDATTFRGTATYDVTFRDFVYSTNPVTDFVDLVKLEKVVFTATQNDTDYMVTYSYFIVPATVTAEKAIHADEPTRDILAVLPLILIAGLIIGVLGYAVYQRME